jgi:hypothetical protein
MYKLIIFAAHNWSIHFGKRYYASMLNSSVHLCSATFHIPPIPCASVVSGDTEPVTASYPRLRCRCRRRHRHCRHRCRHHHCRRRRRRRQCCCYGTEAKDGSGLRRRFWIARKVWIAQREDKAFCFGCHRSGGDQMDCVRPRSAEIETSGKRLPTWTEISRIA